MDMLLGGCCACSATALFSNAFFSKKFLISMDGCLFFILARCHGLYNRFRYNLISKLEKACLADEKKISWYRVDDGRSTLSLMDICCWADVVLKVLPKLCLVMHFFPKSF